MSHLTAFALGIDWALLREQKDYCLNEMENNAEAAGIYAGLVHLIDNLQDAVVDDELCTEEDVFGEGN